MATSPSTIEQILSHLGDTLDVQARKMFGEYGLFLDGRMVALVCDDTLFLKSTPAGLEFLGEHETGVPYPGAKPCPVLDDRFLRRRGKLAELLRLTSKALPAPKPKSVKAPAGRKARRSEP